jgi:hypothetical protein
VEKKDAGSGITETGSLCAIPTLPTDIRACMHRLSTGLCTGALDGNAQWGETVEGLV